MSKDEEKMKEAELEIKGKWKRKESECKTFYYQPVPDKAILDPTNDVEHSLADHTDVDNMDENNKSICKECTKNKGTEIRKIIVLSSLLRTYVCNYVL